MYAVKATTRFQRDLKRAEKRGYKIELLTAVVKKLATGELLDQIYDDHPLKGRYKGYRECHITPYWLLIYKIEKENLILVLTRTGTHIDLFQR